MRETRTRRTWRALALACALLAVPLANTSPLALAAQDKMTAEEVVAKHLESIGPAAARTNVKTLVVAGTSRASWKARNTSGAIDGQIVLASKDNKSVLGMAFPASNYPGEKFGYDGKKFTVGYIKPGVRSVLGTFVLTNGEIIKEGLLGGTLSSAWALANIAERKAKLEYAGTAKVGDVQAHKLRYSPSKGSDLQITLFFDASNFRHVRTQYDRLAGSRLGTGGVDNQAQQRGNRYRLVEDFSDFKKEGSLTLPHKYKMQLEIEAQTGTSIDAWEIALSQFAFNEDLEDSGFDVEGK
jgi:hypothetical protein